MSRIIYYISVIFFFAQIFSNITPSTITVDSINHTYTGTLSSSTYSGYKLATNSNVVVDAGTHTLSGYTGNNITLNISGNTASVNNTKTSTTRTTELQNFIKSNWYRDETIIYKLHGYDYDTDLYARIEGCVILQLILYIRTIKMYPRNIFARDTILNITLISDKKYRIDYIYGIDSEGISETFMVLDLSQYIIELAPKV